MRSATVFATALACLLATVNRPQVDTRNLLVYVESGAKPADWLVKSIDIKSGLFRSKDGRELILSNGLVRRVFRSSPNLATVALDNLMTGAGMLRAVKPEAIVELDGKSYPVGGLTGQPNLAFLRADWIDTMKSDPNAFQYVGFESGPTRPRMGWKRVRHHDKRLPWPPPGVQLTLHFQHSENRLQGVRVSVHYEIYDGIPLMGKWITISNHSALPVRLNRFTAEQLGMVEEESIVESADRWEYPNLTVQTDYSFGGMASTNSNRTVHWVTDPAYKTQVNYDLKTPCVLETRPPIGPNEVIAPGADFETFRTFELLHDSHDKERKGLAIRRMYRTISPWVTENPLMMHLTSVKPETAKLAIDQCAEVGFEMVILSFGSGLNMENDSDSNIRFFKDLVDYAHSKGIELGGYSLLASRRVSDEHDVINPKTMKTGGAIYDNSPCLESKWGQEYFVKLRKFVSGTGFNLLEHDGSYPGDLCASTAHPGHSGLEDSQWRQFRRIADLYRWCRETGIYLNVPDWYFLSGSNKTGIGYRETNWSLPRDQQHIHARQHIYDGTWDKTPTMGWSFVPLVQYQGGGAAATIEPLKDHLSDYERHLMNNLGMGVQACYRGPRLYDSPETKTLVTKWVAFFKQHRQILESDVVHLRRADGRGLDGSLHVNPTGKEKGLVVYYNPTAVRIEREVELPLYYTGLTDKALIGVNDSKPKSYRLDREYKVRIKISVEPGGMTWLVIR